MSPTKPVPPTPAQIVTRYIAVWVAVMVAVIVLGLAVAHFLS